MSQASESEATSAQLNDPWRTTARDDAVTMVLGTWTVLGLVADGATHISTPELETFFTPAHLLIYSGYAATAVWVSALCWSRLRRREGRSVRRVAPTGYGLALVGLMVFGLGGVLDLVWHTAVGVEQNLEALLSPPHLLLFASAALVISAPLRAALLTPSPRAPRMAQFAPVLASTTLTTMLAAFFLLYLSAFAEPVGSAALTAGVPDAHAAQHVQVGGVASVYMTTLLFVFPLLLLLRRWQPPFGTATTILSTVAVLTTAMFGFARIALVVAAVAAGLATDTVARATRAGPEQPLGLRLTAVSLPAALWPAYFAISAALGELSWSAEFWGGAAVMAILGTLALSLLVGAPVGLCAAPAEAPPLASALRRRP